MSRHEDDSEALLRLTLAGGGSAARRRLLERHGSPGAAFAAGPRGWRAAGLDDGQVSAFAAPAAAGLAIAREWLAASPRHHLIGWDSGDYPPLLRHCPHPPLALFVDGDPALLWRPSVAVVGSRSPTAGGRDNAAAFAAALARAGVVVASGMAAGIDAAAHESALGQVEGTTVAVLGTGPEQAYPRRHAPLRDRIAAHGAVVSEHPPGTGAHPSHFPRRNRIIAGLSLATLVIEAAERSGALITARQAADSGRDVFAVPGSIHNPLARGCHRLIRDGAGLVERGDELLDALAPQLAGTVRTLREQLGEPEQTPPERSLSAGGGRDPDYQKLWRALGHDPTGMDQLVDRTGLTTAALSSMLLAMELDGRVSVEHGRYCRKG
ncbi:DNA-processing protein DprA [Pseudoxanthomonas sp. PXM04]|uniref:DNA-processing protein DprA n=1 Tax=Pseudoxanthomonas sp. PXM04 TaxID=2769297 RepID=UPI001784CA7E|nr:DNA-processing protein DprA [Pseudoxanthomonas sp. PXM04]MBD9379400.1 DNA-protecting protein DprA [Pseudoxanthomonas sp. PXM04]